MSGGRAAWSLCCSGVRGRHVRGARGRREADRRASNVVPFSPPRIIDQRFENVSYFVFGDFNFRLDSKSVVEVGTAPSLVGSPQSGF